MATDSRLTGKGSDVSEAELEEGGLAAALVPLARLLRRQMQAAFNHEEAQQSADSPREALRELDASHQALRTDVNEMRAGLSKFVDAVCDIRSDVRDLHAVVSGLRDDLHNEMAGLLDVCRGKGELRVRGVGKASPCLDTTLANTSFARNIFTAGGLKPWAVVRRASRGAKESAEAVQERRLIVACGDKLSQRDGWLKTVEAFGPQRGHWEPLPDTDRRSCHTGAELLGYIYICGGAGNMGRSVMRFDPGSWEWQTMASMGSARARAAAAVANRRLYIIGGEDDGASRIWSSVERFDPARGAGSSESWEAAPDMTVGRNRFAAVSLRGTVFAFGGMDQPSTSAACSSCETGASAECLLQGGNAWEALPPMSLPRRSHAAVGDGGKLYVIGGVDLHGGDILRSIEVFDLHMKVWFRGPPTLKLRRPRRYHGAAVIGGQLYIFGGTQTAHTGGPAVRNVECLDLALGTWEDLEPMQNIRAAFCAALLTLGPRATVP